MLLRFLRQRDNKTSIASISEIVRWFMSILIMAIVFAFVTLGRKIPSRDLSVTRPLTRDLVRQRKQKSAEAWNLSDMLTGAECKGPKWVPRFWTEYGYKSVLAKLDHWCWIQVVPSYLNSSVRDIGIEDVERGAELSFRGRFADPPHVRFADPA